MQRSKVFYLVVVLSMVSALCFAPVAVSGASNDDVKAAYNEYLQNYNQFKAAADQGADADTLRQYADRYKEALEKYQTLLKGTKPVSQEPVQSQEQTVSGSGRIADEPQETSSKVPALKVTDTSLKSVVKALHSCGARNKADQIIVNLENIIKTSKNREEINTAKIELANAYAKFKNDYDKSVELLQQVVNDIKSGPKYEEANRALVRAKWLKQKSVLSGVIAENRKEAQKYKEEYQKVSWTSPIKKVKSWFTYTKNLFSYRKAVTTYKAYKENGEIDKNYVSYEFLTDLIGKRAEFGVGDTFDNTSMPAEDTIAQVRLITDNNEAWYARWYMINAAKNTINMTYFIWEPDAYGKSMLGLLMKKAREGVKINIMIDARGSKALAKTFMGQDYLQKLAACPNVAIKVFNPMHSALPSVLSNIRNLLGSNHQKIIVVDGNLSITGGRNVSLNYFADPRDNETVFRDTDVLVRGAAVAEMMDNAFMSEFEALSNFNIYKDVLGNWSKKDEELEAACKSMEKWIMGQGVFEHPKLKDVNAELKTYKCMVNYANYDPFAESYNASIKLFAKDNFQQEKNDITDNIIALMDACTEEIIIQNPYVILTEKSRAAIKRANDRGVNIIIHTNSPVSTDSILTQAFFLEDWKEFLKATPKAHVYAFVGKNKLHAKVFMFDKLVSVVGTYNMDYMSEQINAENVCAIKSAEFTRDCRNRTFQDISNSKEYKIGIGPDGKPYEVFGPESFTDTKTLTILKLLMKLKILKPLI